METEAELGEEMAVSNHFHIHFACLKKTDAELSYDEEMHVGFLSIEHRHLAVLTAF